MPTLSLHIKTKEGGLIAKPSILLSYFKPEEAGLVTRMSKFRKVDKMNLASRNCTQEEFEIESHPYRMELKMYHNWDLLIADEKKWTDNQDWLGKLGELKLKYPQFNEDLI